MPFDPTVVPWLGQMWAGDPAWTAPASGTQPADMPGDGAAIDGVGLPTWWEAGAEMGGVPIFATGNDKALAVNITAPTTNTVSIVYVARVGSLNASRPLWLDASGSGVQLQSFGFGSNTWKLKAGDVITSSVLRDVLPHVFVAVIDTAGGDAFNIDGADVAGGDDVAGNVAAVGPFYIGVNVGLNDWLAQDVHFFGAFDGDIRARPEWPQMLADAIADIGGQGVTSAAHPLQQIIDDLPNGSIDPDGHINWSTLELSDAPFPYNSDVTLFIEDKQYVRIVGQGGGRAIDRGLRLVAPSDGSGTQPGARDGQPLNWPRTRAHVKMRNCDHVWIDGVTIEGAWRTLGATIWDLEAQAGIWLNENCTNCLIENSWIQGVYGDGIIFMGDGCADNVARYNVITQTGRHGVAAVDCDRCEAYGNFFDIIGRYVLDIETTGHDTEVHDFNFHHNDIGIHANATLLAQNDAFHSMLRYNRNERGPIRVQGNAAGPIYFEHNVGLGYGGDTGAGRDGVEMTIVGNVARSRRDAEAWQRHAFGSVATVARNASNSFVEEGADPA